MPSRLLDNIIVVLVEPQDVVNIAGVVRAMNNMGVRHLRLVRPAEFDPWRIEGIAHRSENILHGARHFDSLGDAVADCTFIVGTSARARTAQRNYTRPRPVARQVVEQAAEGAVALLFGREDRGLSNQALDHCHEVAIIPTDPEFSSLNLAQACLLFLYEIFLTSQEAADAEDVLPRSRRSTRPATGADLEETYAALEAGLHRIDFYKARAPESVLRTIRTVIGRAQPDLREARLLRAIGFEIGNFLDRQGEGRQRVEESSRSDDNTE
jgi:TrmH family RNA methyltransferase